MTDTVCGCCGKPAGECSCWEFPGWGKVEHVDDLAIQPAPADATGASKQLGQWRATAICGNDITSSCLYVSALAALYAGPLAPLALLLVAGVLYLFRNIYAEVGSALPLNGGAYNLLLNTTTKWRAALAACLTLLSYVATAVISGSEAMHYAADLMPSLNIFLATIGLLSVFAILSCWGITDSANVALMIFVFHIFTLILLVGLATVALITDPSTLLENWRTPMSEWPSPRSGGLLIALFFGFSAAMLGISGFESSANYIEEQKPGVFPKTLRNMWIAVAIFNPLISFLSFAVFPMAEIVEYKNALLSMMGHHSVIQITGADAQDFLPRMTSYWISFDAVIVLSGAVLTSYVGVVGLMRRMSLDMCLPQFLLTQNRWRGTNHWIIGLFLAMCCSILLITSGKIEMLAGVYTLSFLSVMALFAGGNLLLKRKHPQLKRTTTAKTPGVIVALAAVLLALVGNTLIDPDYVRVFAIYFVASVAIVGFVFYRTFLLTLTLRTLDTLLSFGPLKRIKLRQHIVTQLHELECRQLMFIVGDGDQSELRKAAEYIRRNEQIRFVKFVWFYEDESAIPAELQQFHSKLDHDFPNVHIDFVLVKSPLSAASIGSIAKRLNIPSNFVFLSSTAATTVGDIALLGGARIVG